MSSLRLRYSGFTLTELMIVVSIIGILASIAIPKLADMVRKAEEGQTKGSLGAIRSALNIYYADMEGQYPWVDFSALTINGKYLTAIPVARLPPYHQDSSARQVWNTFAGNPIPDAGGWIYMADPTIQGMLGQVYLNCVHTDSKGTVWSSY